MKRKIEPKKGATFLGVLVSLFILLGMTSMLVTTSRYFAQNRQDIRTLTTFEQSVNNEVMALYQYDDWPGLTRQVQPTPVGDLVIDYTYVGVNSTYRTRSLQVTFTLDGRSETYLLERSVQF